MPTSHDAWADGPSVSFAGIGGTTQRRVAYLHRLSSTPIIADSSWLVLHHAPSVGGAWFEVELGLVPCR